jgi:acetoin utilization protein AcuB
MNLTVGKIMKDAPITVQEDGTLAQALDVMVWGDVRHLPVLKDDVLLGVLSERDIARRYSDLGHFAAAGLKAGDVMSSPPVTVGPNDGVEAAIKLVAAHALGCLPVVERGRLVGIVTRRDLLAQQAKRDVDEQPTVEAAAKREPPDWAGQLVDDVMSRDPLIASADDPLPAVVNRMGRYGIRHLPVVDSDRHVIGMLSDRDVRTAIGNPLHTVNMRDAAARLESTRVFQAMTHQPMTLQAGTRLSRAAAFFADHKVGALPIVDEDQHLVGLVSYLDVLRAVVGSKSNAS